MSTPIVGTTYQSTNPRNEYVTAKIVAIEGEAPSCVVRFQNWLGGVSNMRMVDFLEAYKPQVNAKALPFHEEDPSLAIVVSIRRELAKLLGYTFSGPPELEAKIHNSLALDMQNVPQIESMLKEIKSRLIEGARDTRLSNQLYRDLREGRVPEDTGTGMIDEVRKLLRYKERYIELSNREAQKLGAKIEVSQPPIVAEGEEE